MTATSPSRSSACRIGGPTVDRDLACLAPLGRVVVYGNAGGEPAAVDPQRLVVGAQTVSGFFLTRYFAHRPALMRSSREVLFGYVRQGRLRIDGGETRPLADAAEVHHQLEARSTVGVTALTP